MTATLQATATASAPAPATPTATASAPKLLTDGRWSKDQFDHWQNNCHKSADKREFLKPNAEQLLYLCLAAENWDLEKAQQRLIRLGISDDQAQEVKQKLVAKEQDGQLKLKRPSFALVDLVSNAGHKKLLEDAVQQTPGCLKGADLEQAKLEGANLSGADLRDTILARADLGDADLGNADLAGAVLLETKLAGAKLAGAQIDAEPNGFQPWYHGVNRFGYNICKNVLDLGNRVLQTFGLNRSR